MRAPNGPAVRDRFLHERRRFLTSASSGLGAAALLSLLGDDGLLGQEATNPTAPKPPHFPAKAKRCIFIFLAGGTSQVELFDPKPKLTELTGQRLPDSVLARERFFALKPEQSLIM